MKTITRRGFLSSGVVASAAVMVPVNTTSEMNATEHTFTADSFKFLDSNGNLIVEHQGNAAIFPLKMFKMLI